jgi:ring-1,2-phenylacetyl-CoA epoxidase subunit PaaC
MDKDLFDYVLRRGDDSLILSQRLTEWCGHAPAIEVDLSLANLGLDLVGQATLFFDYAALLEGGSRDADRLAFHRDAADFRNCLLVEQPNGDFGQTIVRQFLFSTWQKMLFDRLAFSKDETIAAIAAKAVKEISYHADISAEWLIRLGDGTKESHRRVTRGVEWMWRLVPELFVTDDIDADMIARGIGVDPGAFQAEFDARIAAVFAEAMLDVPPMPRNFSGGRRGHHSEHLGHLLCTMQYLPRAYPDAKW